MYLSKLSVYNELIHLLEHLFTLNEVVHIKIRDIFIERDDLSTSKVREALDLCYHDCCSDVDLSVLIRLALDESISIEEYMKRVDRLGFTLENCLGIAFVEESKMYRIIQRNGMRYDFGFEFVYDERMDRLQFEKEVETYNNPYWTMDKVNRFWFVQIQAVAKLYRKDYLISEHMANMNLNETLVQQMVLRDIEYGSNHHRYGYKEKIAYRDYEGRCPYKGPDNTYNLIADKIYTAALTYDKLNKSFYPEYEERSNDFFYIWDQYEIEYSN